MNEGTKELMAIVGLVVATILSTLWGGYVFSVLWTWFIVSAFSAPALSVSQAIGVTMAVRFSARSWDMRKGDESDVGKSVMAALAGPLIVLAVGWVVKQWLPV